MPSEQRIAVIIVDHGSRLGEANEMLEAVAADLRRARPGACVYVAHMELCEPSIGQAFASAVADGATHVVVHPYFLSPGRHSQVDIPRMTREASADHPGVTFAVTEPLGLDELMTRMVWKRVDESLADGAEKGDITH